MGWPRRTDILGGVSRGVAVRVFLVVLSLMFALPAWAGDADDAAIAADDAVTNHCAEGWGEESAKPDALIAIGEALKLVQSAYEKERAPFLLYYRGALYKCLGQFEEALDDLEAFVNAERANPAYAQQVKVAAVQLERAGRAVEAAGAGASASWIRRVDHLEVSLRAGAGVAIRSRNCTEGDSGVLSQLCSYAGHPGAASYAVGAAPLDGRLAVTGFFAAPIGLGVSLTGQWHWADESKDEVTPDTFEAPIVGTEPFSKNNSIDWGITHPGFVAGVGPVIRAANWQSSGRARGLRIEPQFAVGLSWFEPVAGHYLHQTSASSFQTLGGEWRALHLGGALRVEGQAEIGNRTLFLADVRGVVFAPASGERLEQTRPAGGNVRVPLAPTASDRVLLDGGFAVRFVPSDAGVVSVGPDLRLGFDGRWLTFPEGEDHAWDVDSSGTVDSKVFSTLRIKASVILGLTLEFGGG